MASKSNDFHSLLSVFRDATAPGNSSNKAPQRPNGFGGTTGINGNDEANNNNQPHSVEPTSTTDSSYSSSVMRENVERLLRINSIRKSTSSAATKRENVSNNRDDSDIRDSLHIAICATIVQDFPHETLWKKWIEETGGQIDINLVTSSEGASDAKPANTNNSFRVHTSAQLYIHAKKPEFVKSEWLRSKTLPITHRPDWNDVRVIRAMLSLLEAALGDAKTTHILFCTESCVPVVTLREAAISILVDKPCIWEENQDVSTCLEKTMPANDHVDWNRSYIDCYDMNSPRCSRFDEHNCWGHLRSSIPAEAIYKALPGWCLLSRKHAQSILDLPTQLGNMNLWPAFEKVWAPEEVYFPTSLNICGLMDEVVKRTVTHSEWDHKAVNLTDRAHPLCYDGNFDDVLVSQVRRDGCLFLRKMKEPIDMQTWENIVIHGKKGQDRKMSAEMNGSSKRGREWEDERNRSFGNSVSEHRRDRGESYQSRRNDYNHRDHHRGRYDSNRRDYDDRRSYGYDERRRHGSSRRDDEYYRKRRR